MRTPPVTVTRSTSESRGQPAHPDPTLDPITLLRQHQRAALDRQAELATTARRLNVEVADVTRELAAVTSTVNTCRALLAGVAAAAKAAPPVDKDA